MVYLAMKRPREGEVDALTTMANCLMLLSSGSSVGELAFEETNSLTFEETNSPTRIFECKTCNRQFLSFQALGGHRASHKKPRHKGGLDLMNHQARLESLTAAKPKTHECSICGLEFAIGQALGGHMRRHRAAMSDQNQSPISLPVVKKVKSRRVFSLDLNLTPLENDLEFGLGKVAPVVDLYL